MNDQREVTRQHYDRHAQQQQHLPTHLALKQRREGPAAPLKKFHNDIKRRLIYRFGYQAEALIDYACGRGGDIHKWHAAQVGYAKGLDISQSEIEEAQRRFKELQDETQQRGAALRLQAQFAQTDSLSDVLHTEDRQYDVATCMFAIHYFFDKLDSLQTLMQTIASNLKPGGYFIGCVPDGKRVKAHLVKAPGGKLELPHLVLKSISGDYNPFGSSYIMEIPDTVVEGHEGLTEGSHEFVVFDKVLLAEAAKAGLYPVLNYGDPDVNALFEPGDADKPMKHFHPSYPATTDDSLKTASKLYMAFVLQKVDSAQDAAAPPVPPPPRREGGGGGGGGRAAAAGPQGSAGRPQWQGRGGGGNNRMDSLTWTLPYAATSLRPEDLPSVYNNVRHSNLQQRQQLGRWIIYPPPMPVYSGPVQYVEDMHGVPQPVHQRLPDGSFVYDYYAELNYHARQRDMLQQQVVQAFPPPMQQLPDHQHQHQHQHHHQQPSSGRPAHNSHPQQQQQQQHTKAEPPDPPAAAAGRGTRGRGRGRKGATAAAAAGGEGEGGPDGSSAAGKAGRGGGRGGRGGRGSRGGKTAGSKRERPSDGTTGDEADGAAAGAAKPDDGVEHAGNGEPAPTAAAAAAAAGGDAQPAAKRAALAAEAGDAGAAAFAPPPPPAAAGAAAAPPPPAPPAAPAGNPAEKAAQKLSKILAADPMGYKEREAPPDLPPDLLQSLMQHAPQYTEN